MPVLEMIIGLCALIGTDSYAEKIERFQKDCHKYYSECLLPQAPAPLMTDILKCIKNRK